MASLSLTLVALVSPPQVVALSEGPAIASMALLALVLAGVSIVAERLHRAGHVRNGRDGGDGPRPSATRARS